MVEGDDLRHQLLLSLHVAQELDVVDRRLEPVVRPDLRVELREPVAERLGLLELPEGAMMIQAMWRDRLGLLQVVGQSFL